MTVRTRQYFLDKWASGYKVKAADMDDLMESVVFPDELPDPETGDTLKGKLEALSGNNRLSASAIKDLPSPTEMETAESVKAKLESNPDTNTLTDAEKTRIENFIATGVAASLTVVCDKYSKYYNTYTQSANVIFDLDIPASIIGSTVRIPFQSDGLHTIQFNSKYGYVYGLTNNGTDILPAGLHPIFIHFYGGAAEASLPTAASEESSLIQLSTPNGFTATAAGPTQINLSWADGVNESSYLIEVSNDGVSGWSTLVSKAANSTSHAHTGLTVATTRHYRIKAVGDGVSYQDSTYATGSATTTSSTQLTAPSLVATGKGYGTIDLTWNNVPNESSYQIDHSLDNISFSALTTPAANATAYTHSTTDDVTHYYRIKAVGDGSTYTDSSYGTANALSPGWTDFDGVDSHLHFGDILASVITGASKRFAIEMDVRSWNLGTLQRLLFKPANDNSADIGLYIDTAGKVNFSYMTTVSNRVLTTSAITTGAKKLRVEYDGTQTTAIARVKFFVDGVQNATVVGNVGTSGQQAEAIRSGTAGILTVGAFKKPDGTFATLYYDGEMRKFKFQSSTNGTVWTDEINVGYIATGTDTSGNNRNGVWVA